MCGLQGLLSGAGGGDPDSRRVVLSHWPGGGTDQCDKHSTKHWPDRQCRSDRPLQRRVKKQTTPS